MEIKNTTNFTKPVMGQKTEKLRDKGTGVTLKKYFFYWK